VLRAIQSSQTPAAETRAILVGMTRFRQAPRDQIRHAIDTPLGEAATAAEACEVGLIIRIPRPSKNRGTGDKQAQRTTTGLVVFALVLAWAIRAVFIL